VTPTAVLERPAAAAIAIAPACDPESCNANAAYRRHVNAGQPACAASREAHNAYNTQRYADLKAKGANPRGSGRGRHLAPCGTSSAWKRHYKRGEPLDEACREAMVADGRKRYQAVAAPRILEPCGTPAAAQRHRRHGEPLDEACARAKREDAARRHASRHPQPTVADVPAEQARLAREGITAACGRGLLADQAEVGQVWHMLGVHPAIPRSAGGHTKKLTTSQVRVLRERYDAGCTQRVLAADFGCSQALVSALLSGKARPAPDPVGGVL
jgi:hypothetical protein